MKKTCAPLAGALLACWVLACGGGREVSRPGPAAVATAAAAEETGPVLYSVAPPPFSEGIFPCSRCHNELRTNHERRPLRWAHEKIVLHHDEENRWCLDCHSAVNRDKLHLAGGRLLDFTESYKLCGQCHGPQLRDWRAGAHGKRTGSWSGEKQYLLCAHCHDPHSPRFKALAPLPPPVRPANLRPGGAP